MYKQATHQAAALGLAALFTLAMLASVNVLFTEPAPDSYFAQGQAPTHVVSVDGKRAARS